MKKFYTLFSAALIAASALAAPAQFRELPQARFKGDKMPPTTKIQPKHSPKLNTSSLHKIPELSVSPADIITERPAGTVTTYERSSMGYVVFWGSVFVSGDTGAVGEIVKGDNGKTYINVPISGMLIDAWVECTITDVESTVTDMELVIPGYQPVFYDEDYEDYMVLTVLEYVSDDETEDYVPAADQNFRMEISDGQITSINFDQDGDYILGLCYYMPDEYFEWAGFGDWNYEFTPFDGEPLAGPADTTGVEKWAIISDGDGYFVNVGVNDDTLYIQGIYPALPDAWVKASLTDGKGEIETPTYLGVDQGHYIYLQTAEIEEVWYEWYEQYLEEVYPSDTPFVVTYDAEAKKIVGEGVLATTYGLPSEDMWYAVSTLSDPTILKQNRVPGTAPCAAQDITDYDDPDFPYFYFTLPPFDVDGNLLDTSRLFYNVFVDGEIFVFQPDEYERLTEDMTDVPYGFYDNWDIVANGPLHEIYYYWNGVDSIGVRPFYVEEDGSKTYGEMATLDLSSVALINATETSAVYYDLNGLRVANPDKGIFVRRSVMSDGSVKVTKVAR